jgi:membrane protease YdiL (CAAX protease family)
MWVSEGQAFRLGRVGTLLAVALLIIPANELVGMLSRDQWIPAAWAIAAVVGAIAAAYSLTQFARATTRQFFLCLATAGTAGVVLVSGAAAARAVGLHQPLEPRIGIGLKSLMLYFPVTFLLEEVAFRGAIDAHVQRPDARRGFWSAVAVSTLWGLWHWPIVPHGGVPWAVTAIQLVGVHTIIGVPLSIFWRRSGNLAVPAFTHAFIDAVRNALLHP